MADTDNTDNMDNTDNQDEQILDSPTPEKQPLDERSMDEKRAGVEHAPDILDTGHSRSVEQRTVENVMEDSYLRYSMSVIIDRALPDVRDGLKPVHRRILYTMNRDGLRSGSGHRKSATVVGAVMGDYHPHGDASNYDSMVRSGAAMGYALYASERPG